MRKITIILAVLLLLISCAAETKTQDTGVTESKEEFGLGCPTIAVAGEVEFCLAGDVAIPQKNFGFVIKNKLTGEEIKTSRHSIINFDSSTELYCELTGTGAVDYTYYFEEKYLETKKRTLVYIVIDKEMVDYGYVYVNGSNIGNFWDPYLHDSCGICIDSDARIIPVLPYGDSRKIKLECGTYAFKDLGISGNPYTLIYPKFRQEQITVVKGETVELSYASNFSTYIVSSPLLSDGDYYNVGLLYNGIVWSYLYPHRVEDGKLTIPVSVSPYDSLIIYNADKNLYYKIDTAIDVGTTQEYSADFSSLLYEEEAVAIPAGRVKIQLSPNGLLPCNFSEVYYRLEDSTGAIQATGALSETDSVFNLSSETKIAFADPLNLGKAIVTLSKENDLSGTYTLLKVNLADDEDETGTLVINYSVPEELTIPSNSIIGSITSSETWKTYEVRFSKITPQSYTLKTGDYYGSSLFIFTDSTGKIYTSEIGKFTVRKGETTTITTSFKKQDDH